MYEPIPILHLHIPTLYLVLLMQCASRRRLQLVAWCYDCFAVTHNDRRWLG